jgi:transcriptional regulator with XRE-family HTH domain
MRKILCEKIKKFRKLNGLSQQEVADVLFMSQNSYSELESGKRKIDVELLSKIAGFYKISIFDLFEDILSVSNQNN